MNLLIFGGIVAWLAKCQENSDFRNPCLERGSIETVIPGLNAPASPIILFQYDVATAEPKHTPVSPNAYS